MKRKMLCFFSLVIFVILLSGITCADEKKCTIYGFSEFGEAIQQSLEVYFEGRVENYYNRISSDAKGFESEQYKRIAALETWKENCDFEILTVKTEVIKLLDRRSGSDSIIQLSEINDISYRFKYESEARKMKYEIVHILHVSDNGTIISDTYYEMPSHYMNGFGEELLAVLGGDVENKGFCDMFTESSDNKHLAAITSYSYSGSAAISYSNSWCMGYNPLNYYYGHFNNSGIYVSTDCCNFVSQCIYAGGMPMTTPFSYNYGWSTTWTSGTAIRDVSETMSTYAWMNTQGFRNYWISQGRPHAVITVLDQIGGGNPVFWILGESRPGGGTYETNHNMLIVGLSGTNILVNSHSPFGSNLPVSYTNEYLHTLLF